MKVLKLGGDYAGDIFGGNKICADCRRFSMMSDLKMHTPRVSVSHRGRKY